jgi:hypothetical protein
METNNPQIQFTDSTQKPTLSTNNKILLAVIGVVFIVGSLFYFFAVHPAQVCAENAKKETDQLFDLQQKTNLTLPVSDRKTTETILLNRCLKSKGISSSNATLANPTGLLIGIIVEFIIIFLYLFLFSSQYESNAIKFYRAIILAAFLIVISAIGHAFGFIALIIAAILNLIAIMFILGYSFSGAFLFSIGLELTNYLVVFLISSALK